MMNLSGIAPVTDAEQLSDIVTHIKSGGSFYLPAEAVILLAAAALLCSAAAVFFISSATDKKGKDK